MGEYLRDELARTCKVKRPKFLGFGKGTLAYAGNATPGVANRQTIQYNGPGIFNVMGIFSCAWTVTAWQVATPSRSTYSFTLYDANLRAILNDAMVFQPSFNGTYDNLDHGFIMCPTDYFVFETRSFSATVRQFGGYLWGDEYLF